LQVEMRFSGHCYYIVNARNWCLHGSLSWRRCRQPGNASRSTVCAGKAGLSAMPWITELVNVADCSNEGLQGL
jgi:hypothetical protein